MGSIITADNQVLSHQASVDITALGVWPNMSVELLLRVTTTGCYFGPDGVDNTSGFELLPNTDYKFYFANPYDVPNGSDRTVSVFNNSGGSATVHWVLTPQPR